MKTMADRPGDQRQATRESGIVASGTRASKVCFHYLFGLGIF